MGRYKIPCIVMCQLLPYRSEVAPEFWIYEYSRCIPPCGPSKRRSKWSDDRGESKKFPLLLDKGGQLEYLFYIQHQSLSRNSSAWSHQHVASLCICRTPCWRTEFKPFHTLRAIRISSAIGNSSLLNFFNSIECSKLPFIILQLAAIKCNFDASISILDRL